MFLIGAEAPNQLCFEFGVAVGEAVGVSDLRAVEFQGTAIGSELHRFEADGSFLIAPVDAKGLDRPIAPFASPGLGHDVGPVATSADPDLIIAATAAVECKNEELIDVASQAGDDCEFGCERRRAAFWQVCPSFRGGEWRDRFYAAGAFDG